MWEPVVTRVALAAATAAAAPLLFPPAVDAAFPGRDGLIAFTRAVGPKPGQIYLVRPDGRRLRRLTHRHGGAGAPAWSPDGRRIAAVRGRWPRDGRHYGSVVVMRADGSRRRAIYAGRELSSSHPTWSPDGRWIAFDHTDSAARRRPPVL
jgi:TolB protein